MVPKGKVIYDLPGTLIRFLRPVHDRFPRALKRQVAGQPRAWCQETEGVEERIYSLSRAGGE